MSLDNLKYPTIPHVYFALAEKADGIVEMCKSKGNAERRERRLHRQFIMRKILSHGEGKCISQLYRRNCGQEVCENIQHGSKR